MFDKDHTIMLWQKAEKELETIKTAEMNLRKLIFGECFPNPKEGTNSLELGAGYILKGTHKLSYSVTNNDAVCTKALEAIHDTGNEGPFIAERLIKWKPELSTSEYKKADDKYKKLLEPCLTIKPGSPSLELVAPKGK